MARILIDVCAVSETWFKSIIKDLVKSRNVYFVYSDYEKYRNEVAKNGFLGQFLKLMKQKGRRDDTDPAKCSQLIGKLMASKEWNDEEACDDPHIFAIAYQKPGVFVFTSDKRLVKCRASMRNVINKKFRKFSTIQSKANYDANIAKIKS